MTAANTDYRFVFVHLVMSDVVEQRRDDMMLLSRRCLKNDGNRFVRLKVRSISFL